MLRLKVWARARSNCYSKDRARVTGRVMDNVIVFKILVMISVRFRGISIGDRV